MSQYSEILSFFAYPFALSVLLVAIHAYLGLHVIQREVIFVDISLAQVAALGGAASLLWAKEGDESTSLPSSLAFCLLAALLLATFRRYEKRISQETLIGITYAFASGVLVLVMDRLPHGTEHLKEALVGNILFVGKEQVIQTGLVYGIVGIIHWIFREAFWRCSRHERQSFFWDFLFYLLFGVVITFSTHHAGVLVVFSLLVAPAALACRFADRVRDRLLLAWLIGLVCTTSAFILSYVFDWPAGAGLVAVLTGAFFLTLFASLLYEKVIACRSS
ncbi:MAG: hypothetical protein C5B49_06085 [Bdellovibrio sp.]|nr:MAG: hypothetical protein C5B49_06085 [Bdellovibrio sp.]